MIVQIEVLRKIKKRIDVAFVIYSLIIISSIIIYISFGFIAKNYIDGIIDYKYFDNYLKYGIKISIIPQVVFFWYLLRYIYISYFNIDYLFIGKTKYYPEIFIISLFVPIANIVYTYIYLNEIFIGYGGNEKKKANAVFVLAIIVFEATMIVRILNGFAKIDWIFGSIPQVYIDATWGLIFTSSWMVIVIAISGLLKLQEEKLRVFYAITE